MQELFIDIDRVSFYLGKLKQCSESYYRTTRYYLKGKQRMNDYYALGVAYDVHTSTKQLQEGI